MLSSYVKYFFFFFICKFGKWLNHVSSTENYQINYIESIYGFPIISFAFSLGKFNIELWRPTEKNGPKESQEGELRSEKHVKKEYSDEQQSRKPQLMCGRWRRIILPAGTSTQHPENILSMRLQPLLFGFSRRQGCNAEVTEACLPPSSWLFPFFSLPPSHCPSGCHTSLNTTSVSDVWLALHSRTYRQQAGCTEASDASKHCVTLAVAAVVNVDWEASDGSSCKCS